MTPATAVIWICVFVFAITCGLTLWALGQRLLHRSTPGDEHERAERERYFSRLYYAVIIQIASVGIGAFAFAFSQNQQTERLSKETTQLEQNKVSTPTLDEQLRSLEVRISAVEQRLEPRISQRRWMKLREGADCSGLDVGETPTVVPAAGNCTSDLITAVCWDGTVFRNPTSKNGSPAWCTYKRVAAEDCTGGGRPGIVYRCSQQ
jgi:hypothetical protein